MCIVAKIALLSIVKRHIAPGSIIVSDEWATYNELDSMGLHSFNSISQEWLNFFGEKIIKTHFFR
ncbi:LOW QUALITY PROTEIN: hypothetical protein HZS_4647 [Henneguya salminicola]|nr:LOW QUALITY PROTEIN: hypothetical protein HZS_4647 [Henneguya salminicola]